jgi:hypothetical protein
MKMEDHQNDLPFSPPPGLSPHFVNALADLVIEMKAQPNPFLQKDIKSYISSWKFNSSEAPKDYFPETIHQISSNIIELKSMLSKK